MDSSFRSKSMSYHRTSTNQTSPKVWIKCPMIQATLLLPSPLLAKLHLPTSRAKTFQDLPPSNLPILSRLVVHSTWIHHPEPVLGNDLFPHLVLFEKESLLLKFRLALLLGQLLCLVISNLLPPCHLILWLFLGQFLILLSLTSSTHRASLSTFRPWPSSNCPSLPTSIRFPFVSCCQCWFILI